MQKAQSGDTVQVNYVGKFEDGTVFDSTEGDKPLEFTLGSGDLIPGFEQAVIGMAVGEFKTVTIPAEQGYGPRIEQFVQEFERSQLPPDLDIEKGQVLELQSEDEQIMEVLVVEVTDKVVVIDANHPLAGKTLIFDIKLMAIV